MSYQNMIRKTIFYLRNYGLRTSAWYTLQEIKLLFRMAFLGSYTPYGEDILIDKLLGTRKRGFYVDIGAYGPSRFSNTKRFYLKGWRGINIEPNPRQIEIFNKSRPRDINLNIGISNKKSLLNFFRFELETLSTFSVPTARRYQKQGYKLIETIKVGVFRLGDVLEKYCKDKPVDFFSIDTEGFDFQVLEGNNWNKFRPKIICVEIPSDMDPNYSNPERKFPLKTERFLAKLGYKKVGRTVSNQIFQLQRKKLLQPAVHNISRLKIRKIFA